MAYMDKAQRTLGRKLGKKQKGEVRNNRQESTGQEYIIDKCREFVVEINSWEFNKSSNELMIFHHYKGL